MAFQLQKNGKLHFSVSMVSAVVIDNIGIVSAVNLGMSRSLKKLTGTIPFKWNSSGELVDVVVKLDGGLKAPSEFIHQETIIKGDSKEKVIGLASIVAKVTRDRYMVRKSAEPIFAPYNLEAHKGYGTKAHRAAIKENGLSVIHRRSFCKNLLS